MLTRYKLAFPLLITLSLLVAVTPALARQRSSHEGNQNSHTSFTLPSHTPQPVTQNPFAQPTAAAPVAITLPATPAVVSAGEVSLSAYVTGYSYWDNTPAGSTAISNPVIHSQAGGTGTYADPITLAVGHSIINGKDILDYPAGMKFYLPYLEKYAIVEDTCGDGNTPQNGPCHTGYQGHVWVDLYVDGSNVSQSSANTCMDNITDIHTIIENPASTYPVLVGSVTGSGCKMF